MSSMRLVLTALITCAIIVNGVASKVKHSRDHDSGIIEDEMDEVVDNAEQGGKWVWSEASNKWVWKISANKVKQREDEHLNEGDHDSDVIQNEMDEEVNNAEQNGKWVWSEASNKWVWKISDNKEVQEAVNEVAQVASASQLNAPPNTATAQDVVCSGPPAISPQSGTWSCNSVLTRCHLSCSTGYLPQCEDGLEPADSTYFCEASVLLITGGFPTPLDAELITQTLNGQEVTCEHTPPPLTESRRDHTTFYYNINKEIFVCGGELSGSSCSSITPTAQSWTHHTLPASIGEGVKSVKDREEKKVIFIGGTNYDNSQYSTPTSLSLPISRRPALTAVPNLSYKGSHPCVTLLNDYSFLIIGGEYKTNVLSDVTRYSLLGLTNNSLAPTTVPRYKHACATLNMDGREFVAVTGGLTTFVGRDPIASSEILDVNKNTWTQMKPLQERRYGHVMVATRAGVLVVGGLGHVGGLTSIETLKSTDGSWLTQGRRIEKSKRYFGITEVPSSFFQCNTEQVLADVSCGGHRAASCSSCGPSQQYCHGDCEWNGSKCRKQEVQEALNEVAEVASASQLNTPPNTATAQDADVSCGGHRAASCSSCGPSQQFCHGDCEWNGGKCRKQEVQEAVNEVAQVASASQLMAPQNTATAQDADVSCGGHRAVNCSLCGSSQPFCNGDCEWNGEKCIKREVKEAVNEVAQVASASQLNAPPNTATAQDAEVQEAVNEVAQVASASQLNAPPNTAIAQDAGVSGLHGQLKSCREDLYGKHGIGCCVEGFTAGDNTATEEIFIQPYQYNSTCSNTCKTLHRGCSGITESVRQIYNSGNGRGHSKCWCEFGKPVLKKKKDYQTCVFRDEKTMREHEEACSSYTLLTDQWRRIDNSNTTKYLHCDNKNTIINKDREWYRLGLAAGSRIPEGASSVYNATGARNCGTSFIAYIVDREYDPWTGAATRDCHHSFHCHPSLRDGVKKKFVCFESAATQGNSYHYCKGNMEDMDVAACKKDNEEYFVYKLNFRHHLFYSAKPSTEGCYAYCAVE